MIPYKNGFLLNLGNRQDRSQLILLGGELNDCICCCAIFPGQNCNLLYLTTKHVLKISGKKLPGCPLGCLVIVTTVIPSSKPNTKTLHFSAEEQVQRSVNLKHIFKMQNCTYSTIRKASTQQDNAHFTSLF